ncbi:MAG: hypothetical protein WAW13_00125 [Minisyncoccia bacterium]
MNIPAEIIVAALHIALYSALLLAIPIAIRWWLKNHTWGTFGVYFFVLSAGLIMQSVYQELRNELALSSLLFFAGVACVLLSAYFMYKNFLHVEARFAELKKGRPG